MTLTLIKELYLAYMYIFCVVNFCENRENYFSGK